jgi:HEAT repeat protein
MYDWLIPLLFVITLALIRKPGKWMLFSTFIAFLAYGTLRVWDSYQNPISYFTGHGCDIITGPQWDYIIPQAISAALLFLSSLQILAIFFSKTRERRLGAWIGGIAGILLSVPLALILPVDYLGLGQSDLPMLFFCLGVPGVAIGGAIGNIRAAKGLHTNPRRIARWVAPALILWLLCFTPFLGILRLKVTTIGQMEQAHDVQGLLWKINALSGKDEWDFAVSSYASVDPEGALRDKRKEVRYEAAIQIASGGDNRRAIPVLLEAMSQGPLNGQPDRSGGYAFRAARELSYFQDPRALPYLAQALSNSGPRDVEDAVFAIGLIPGQQSTELLAKALKSKSSNARSQAARELAERGDTRSLPVLAELMRTGTPDERKSEVWCVSGITNDIVIPLLKQAVKSPTDASAKKPSKP